MLPLCAGMIQSLKSAVRVLISSRYNVSSRAGLPYKEMGCVKRDRADGEKNGTNVLV